MKKYCVQYPFTGMPINVSKLSCCGFGEVSNIECNKPIDILIQVAHYRFNNRPSWSKCGGYLFTEKLTLGYINPTDYPRESAYTSRRTRLSIPPLRSLIEKFNLGTIETLVEEMYNYNENHLVTMGLWRLDEKELLYNYRDWWLNNISYHPNSQYLEWQGSPSRRTIIKLYGEMPKEISTKEAINEYPDNTETAAG